MHIANLIVELGASPDEVFSEVGISADLFLNPENTISAEQLELLLVRCVAATDCEYFGLLLGAGAIGNPLGLLGEVLVHCKNVGTAIAYFQQYFHLHDRIGLAIRSTHGKVGAIGYTLFGGKSPGSDQISDGAVAVAVSLLRHLVGPFWSPTAVHLPRSTPVDVKPYINAFGCVPHFGAMRAEIHFPTTDFTRKIANADPTKFALLSERLHAVADQNDLSLAEQVARVARALLVLQRGSRDSICAMFSMSTRSMNRALQAEGTTYRQIWQDARRALAERLISRTDMPLEDISVMLGYSEASALTRAFRGWHGCSPRVWRDARKAGHAASHAKVRR